VRGDRTGTPGTGLHREGSAAVALLALPSKKGGAGCSATHAAGCARIRPAHDRTGRVRGDYRCCPCSRAGCSPPAAGLAVSRCLQLAVLSLIPLSLPPLAMTEIAQVPTPSPRPHLDGVVTWASRSNAIWARPNASEAAALPLTKSSLLVALMVRVSG
jgi:hypothetical protein